MAPGLFNAAGTAVLAVAVSLAVHVALNSPIQPVMSPPRPANRYPPNGLLQRLEKLGEGRLSGPEAVYVDAAAGGTVYTATRDGWLQRMHPNGSWENWRFVGGSGLLGIGPSADGSMLVCDADKRSCLFVAIAWDTAQKLCIGANIPGIAESWRGRTCNPSCFSGRRLHDQACRRFGRGLRRHGLLQRRQHQVRLRQLVPRLPRVPLHRPPPQVRPPRRRDDRRARRPRLRQRRRPVARRGLPRDLRIDAVNLPELCYCRLAAPARSSSDHAIFVKRRYRCLKLWLKGEKAGQAETFVDNLPGSPDNIRLAPDGSFWVALFQARSTPWLDLITRWTLTKRVVASFPVLVKRIKATVKGAMVAQVSENGEIIRVLDDAEGKVINFVTSATEFNGYLFLGSLSTNFIGKLSLAQVPQGQDAVSS